MRQARFWVLLAFVVGLVVGYASSGLVLVKPAEAQGVFPDTKNNLWADVITASEDGSRVYVWTFSKSVRPESQTSPRCLGYVDAKVK